MLSLFPTLLDWNWYVPLFFRLFLGYYFLSLGLHMTKRSDEQAWKILGALSSLVGILFIIGIFVQLLGVISSVSALVMYSRRKMDQFKGESGVFYVLLSLISISLLFLGAGPFAVDLPL